MRNSSISLKLSLSLVLAVLLTAMCGSGAAILIGRRIIRNAVLEANINNVRTYAGAIDFYIENARSLLGSTLSRPETGDEAAEPAGAPRLSPIGGLPGRQTARNILGYSRVFEYVMLLKADGTVSFLEPYGFEAKMSHRNLAFAAWYKQLSETRETVISDLHISPATGRPTVVVAVPIYGTNGRLLGIWAGGLRLREISEVGRGESKGDSSGRYGYVTDSRGLVIAHQRNSAFVENQTDLSSHSAVRAALAGQSGSAVLFNPLEEHEEIVAYMQLGVPRWAVISDVPSEVAFAPLHKLTRGLIGLAVALAALFGLAGYAMVRRVFRPVGQLTVAAHEIGTGDLRKRIEVTSGDEIGQLAGEFNRMVAALGEKDAELRRHIDQLQASNKELESFSYSVSHDLRAPLRHMQGFGELLKQNAGKALDEQNRRHLDIILDSSREMATLIDELLSFSRMGRVEQHIAGIDLNELVRDAVGQLTQETQGRSIDWRIGPLPKVQGDRAMLRLAVVNLLANAVKFTRTRTETKIEVGALNGKPDEVTVFVRDNGVGFDMRYVDKLFGVFQRLHRQSEFEGTGIGLANVRRIISRHGGRTWAEGEVDKRATFYFSLPLTKDT